LIVDLFYGRLHRYRLTGTEGPVSAYALVRRDPAFAAELFGRAGGGPPPSEPPKRLRDG
jgi:hypothetical protein